jgi:hypothetical protein
MLVRQIGSRTLLLTNEIRVQTVTLNCLRNIDKQIYFIKLNLYIEHYYCKTYTNKETWTLKESLPLLLKKRLFTNFNMFAYLLYFT